MKPILLRYAFSSKLAIKLLKLVGKKKKAKQILRARRVYEVTCINIFFSLNFSHHVAHFISRTYLSYNWKFVPFEHLHSFLLPS